MGIKYSRRKNKNSRRKNKNSRRKNIKHKGGMLQIKQTDLINQHMCRKKDDNKYKESTGYEVYVAINDSFILDESTLGFLLTQFKKTDNKWFKFVVFDNDGIMFISIISGSPINKHSVCMLQGILHVTKETDEYSEIRDAFNDVIEMKKINRLELQEIESNIQIKKLNEKISEGLPCMPVISAGSGTINDDGSICLNTKSGHYKPTIESIHIAQELFTKLTGKVVYISQKENKAGLKEKYGDDYDQYTGICL